MLMDRGCINVFCSTSFLVSGSSVFSLDPFSLNLCISLSSQMAIRGQTIMPKIVGAKGEQRLNQGE